MVLPRMRRPAALAAVPAAPIIPIVPPSFATAPERGSRRWIFLAGGALLVALAVIAYRSTGQAPEAEVKATEMGGAGWVTEWASDATGSSRGRQISLYRPSLTMSNYRLEFLAASSAGAWAGSSAPSIHETITPASWRRPRPVSRSLTSRWSTA